MLYLHLAALVLGCTSAPPATPSRPMRPAPLSEAEQALAAAMVTDYRAPALDTRFAALERAADLYVKACERDRRPSDCVWAYSLGIEQGGPTWDARETRALRVLVPLCVRDHDRDACAIFDGNENDFLPAYFEDVEADCMTGLLVACHALAHRLAPTPPTWPLNEHSCASGDWQACYSLETHATHLHEPQSTIDEWHGKTKAAARAACRRGSPYACIFSSESLRDKDMAEVERLAAPFVEQRCPRGYLSDCMGIGKDDRWLAFRCSRTGVGCEFIGDATNPVIERDALETGCQFQRVETCAELGRGYRQKRFPEPVPGRAEAIKNYVCMPEWGSRPCDRLNE